MLHSPTHVTSRHTHTHKGRKDGKLVKDTGAQRKTQMLSYLDFLFASYNQIWNCRNWEPGNDNTHRQQKSMFPLKELQKGKGQTSKTKV